MCRKLQHRPPLRRRPGQPSGFRLRTALGTARSQELQLRRRPGALKVHQSSQTLPDRPSQGIGLILLLICCLFISQLVRTAPTAVRPHNSGDEEWIEDYSVSNDDSMEALLAAFAETHSRLDETVKGIRELVDVCTQRLENPSPFPPFNAEIEEWECYEHRLKQHFLAFGITDETRQKRWFLSWLTPAQYQLLGKLSPTTEPAQLEFRQICGLLSKHYEKSAHVITARLDFYNCTKRQNQSYRSWAAELQGLAKKCKFLTKLGESYADTMIRDVIIKNAPDRGFRLQALQLADPSTEDLLQLAQAFLVSREAGRQVEQCNRSLPRPTIRVNREEPMDLDYNTRKSRLDSRRPGRGPTSKNLWSVDSRRQQLPSCATCLTEHRRAQCPNRWAACTRCGRVGHLAEVCRQQQEDNCSESTDVDQEAAIMNVHTTIRQGGTRIYVSARINNQNIDFQMDTGSVASIINYDTYVRLGSPALHPPRQNLITYNMEDIPLLGQFRTQIFIQDHSQYIDLLVAKAPRANNLLGMDVFKHFFKITLLSPTVLRVDQHQFQEDLRRRFSVTFQSDLGCVKNFSAHIRLRSNAVPKYFKARPVPFSLESKVKEELARLEQNGVITPITHSDWATPLVIVHKPNGNIRLCGDFKCTVNPQIEVDTYPMPKPEDLYVKLAGCRIFSKIDLAEAYTQLPLDSSSKRFMVINTIAGLYQYNRLIFGIASAPAIFQRFMEQLLQGIPHCITYLDDILVAGKTEEEHDKTLYQLLTRLQENGLRCNLDKCKFRQEEIPYLGHIISERGIQPSPENIEALEKLPTPTSVRQVQAFMGKVSFYRKFIPAAADLLKPLTELTKKNHPFVWTPQCEQAFRTLKKKLQEAPVLTAYRPELPLLLTTDASEVGIGAVLAHKMADGTEHPIAFASKTLTETQRKYSQIEREALAIIFGVTKFSPYLYGNTFQLITDHRPLVALFNPSKKLPDRTAHRLLRWALFLSQFQYTITYKSTSEIGHADALSRLPQGPDPKFDAEELMCCHLEEDADQAISGFPILASEVARQTSRDPLLQQVIKFIQDQWPQQLKKEDVKLQPLWRRRQQLSIRRGVILLQTDSAHHRVVIPASLRPHILHMLHEGHWGLARTKALARMHVFWPGLDRDIEDTVRRCSKCASQQAAPPQRFSPWPPTTEPWERIHLDFAGPFHKSIWLILVDTHTNFPFVQKCNSTSASATIKILQNIFALEGLPKSIVTDNGPQFRAAEFRKFCDNNGIQLLHSPPFHPQSNGVAERLVRTFKTQISKFAQSQNIETALLHFLASYRATPLADGVSPAMKLHGRQPRTPLHLLTPDTAIRPAQPKHKFKPGDTVWARGFGPQATWVEGVLIECKGQRVCKVRIQDREVMRHQNQLRVRIPTDNNTPLRRSSRRRRQPDVFLPLPPRPPSPEPAAQPPPAPATPRPASPTRQPDAPPSWPTPERPASPPPGTQPPSPHRTRSSRRHFAPYSLVGPRHLTSPDAMWTATSSRGRHVVQTPHSSNSAGRKRSQTVLERGPRNISALKYRYPHHGPGDRGRTSGSGAACRH